MTNAKPTKPETSGNPNSTRTGRTIGRLDDRKLAGIAPVEISPSGFGNKEPDYQDEIAEERETKKAGR